MLEYAFVIEKIACWYDLPSFHNTPFPFSEGGFCCKLWTVLMWFSSYKRGVLYIVLDMPIWVCIHYNGSTLFPLLVGEVESVLF